MLKSILLTTLSFLSLSYTWGPIGHSSIANIAQNLLSPNANSHVTSLLQYKYNGNMSNAANWADEVRILPEFKWSAPLHFINTPDWKCNYIRSRDCYDQTEGKNFCVDMAIQNYTTLLKKYNDVDSLKFIIHFVGDIHQPLHCGFIGDRGGNDIIGHFYKRKTNLHAIWDSEIIEKRLDLDFDNNPIKWQNYIYEEVITKQKSKWDPCIGCTDRWGNESVKDACEYSYVYPDNTPIQTGFELEDDYYNRVISIIETQIGKAAYRLSNLLNYIYNYN